jgi:undecaprenyl-diphosphatase
MTKRKNKNYLTKLEKISPRHQVFIAIGLLIIAIILTRSPEMSGFEESIFLFVYGWPSVFELPFLVVTQFGSIYILGAIVAVLLIKNNYSKALRFILVGTSAYLIAGFVKDLWGRARPNELLDGIVNLDYARGPGFPSGHTALAVALALTVGHFLPRKYHWIVVVWIVAVGLSRIYLGVHAPLDILGGFAIGWLCYALFKNVRISNIGRRIRRS